MIANKPINIVATVNTIAAYPEPIVVFATLGVNAPKKSFIT